MGQNRRKYKGGRSSVGFFQGRNKRRQRGRGGQIAVFVVLIFQTLFVFFAFALNVALVVHDKINLQNSLDLAALYGAQKQAEVLNVLAHINFQMRQNFKLLTFRYRVLGSVSYHKGPAPGNPDVWCPYAIPSPDQDAIVKFCHRNPLPVEGLSGNSSGFAGVTADTPGGVTTRPCENSPYGPDYCDANYFVCVSSAVWQGRGRNIDINTNHCKHLEAKLQAVVPFPVLGGIPLLDPVTTLLGGTLELRDELSAKCQYEGVYNWLTTQMFLGHFRLDQKDRKSMIREIYRKTLYESRDLDGNFIREGARKTFENNLTYTNRKNFDKPDLLISFNSPSEKTFKEFFTPINIYPVLEYLDFPGNNGDSHNAGSCGNSNRKPHFDLPVVITGPPSSPSYPPPSGGGFPDNYRTFMNDWKWLFAISTRGGSIIPPADAAPPFFFEGEESPLIPLTLGYERKPLEDGVFYYGLSVALEYNAAFPLFFPGLAGGGGLELKASAFAKPFGGRMGPKYSVDNEKDPLIGHIVHTNTQTGNLNFNKGNPYLLKPNYSRYPRDKWGLIHREVHEDYYLKQLDSSINSPDPWPFDMIYFSHLHGGDPLAYDNRAGTKHKLFLRMMELMAVAPDLYDLTYYTILNQYMTAYFPRICRLFLGRECPPAQGDISLGTVSYGTASGAVQVFLRGDFGFPYTHEYAKLNKNNFTAAAPSSPLSPFYFNLGKTNFSDTHIGGSGAATFINTRRGAPPWLVRDPAHFLTAWAPVPAMDRYDSYAFPEKVFGKCQGVADDTNEKRSPTGCAAGGRAGYSVKLISCEAAKRLKPAPPDFPCS